MTQLKEDHKQYKTSRNFQKHPGTSFGNKQHKHIIPMCLFRALFNCTMNNCESEEIVEAANIAISNLLPTKSRSLYDIAYNRFKKWCAEKNVQVYSKNVLLAYFSENAKNYKSSTLWAQYSMVKSCLIIYDNIDISKFPKLIAFLKRTGDGYQAKKSKILTKSEIDRFLSSADDK
ncbi:hypothetical protein NQ317_013898 [Molorchus minor]|uniref:Uncharacterized protein n=1 Tax=Molorchus minor TaxID=1323400 RepID=A0ABQ9K6S5_9CUCU|nr:hypothetical protein NQ317_013898 [Molorchus minor]